MRVGLPFGRQVLDIEVPDHATVLRPHPVAPIADEDAAVRQSLRSPLAGLPLRERVQLGQTVAIVVSDITRPVPNAVLLPPIIDELHAAGIPDEAITIVNGTGLHRINTQAELEEMLGAELANRYRIVQHVARDSSTLTEVGRSAEGVPVSFCTAYVEADVRIVTGFVEPHLFAGYSGGAKGVMPGVAGARIVMSNHGADNLSHPKASWCVAEGNPVFEEMRVICDLCPPHFLLNVTLDSERHITGVFAGDLLPAHEAAMQQAERQYVTPIAQPYDVVVVTNMGYPADTSLYQSVKGMSVAAEGVRQGGAILLVAGCEEGIGSDDYAGLLSEGESMAALLERICSNQEHRHDQWQVQCQAMVQAKARVLVHSLLTPEQARSAHVEPCDDPSAAIRELVAAAQARGLPGSVLVLPHGQMTVPVVR
ncbi:MAG TPA: nickel-dependent lactate racemase [Dehalococcoidia bacterium]|nr:nickel-dependent lactate racemase [Dehalococcoidia bacterium]